MVGVFLLVFGVTFIAHRIVDQNAKAANFSGFDAGYIISDYQMTNFNSMNEAQIQAFLKSKVDCDDRDLGKYTYGEKVGYYSESLPYTWHVGGGHFICMADEGINGESAAHIIWQAAQDYRINPQVLITVLQKEQWIVTDSFPNSVQYKSAMGYACPDTAPCAPGYAGFKNQVRGAASLFREVMDGGWSNYPVGQTYVQYNPNADCGGSVVNIRNKATSALYRYTSYQPNAAALSVPMGVEVSCGAYGNKNFYGIFEDWFGGITWEQGSTKIADGTYYIENAIARDYVVDVDGGSDENGTNIQLYTANGTKAQIWDISYNSSTDDYNIINTVSKKALDVEGAGVEKGTNIQLYDANRSCAQRWKIIETSKNVVKLISSCSSNALDVSGGVMDNGTNIGLWLDNGTPAQEWILEPTEEVEDGMYFITSSLDNNKVLDITGGTSKAISGTNVQIWSKNETAAQRWYIERGSDGYYTIINKQTSMSFDLYGGENRNGANMRVWSNNGTCAQKWQILKVDGAYTFISACSHKVIDLAAANTKSGANIQAYEANNTSAQRWNLEPVKLIKDGNYKIISALADDKVLDLANNSNRNGANIHIYKDNGTDAQKWQISYDVNTGFYMIANRGVDKVVDVAGANKEIHTNVQSWSSNNTNAQKWMIVKEGEYYVFYSACSDLLLDVTNASSANGTNVQMYKEHNTDAQRWKLIEL